MRNHLAKPTCIALMLAITGPAAAAPPVLVKDINAVPTGSTLRDSYPANPLALNGRVYFSATAGSTGTELYVTDGNTSTILLRDINPGGNHSNPSYLTALDATRFVFAATDATKGTELWISDGTTAGTTMVKDINSNGASNSSPRGLTNIGGGIVVFWATDGNTNGGSGTEVWRTDGTSAGTYRLSDIAPGGASAMPNYASFNAFAGKVFFPAQNTGTNNELYTTDGTNLASTALFKEINASATIGSAPQSFAVLSPTQMLFRASDGVNGQELWTTDGTAAGTAMLKDIQQGPGGSAPGGLTKYSGKIYFAANGGLARGRELYVSDGTAAGTTLLKDCLPGALSSNPRYFTACNGKLFFSAADLANGVELWITDGTPAGTKSLNSVAGSIGLDPWNLCCINFTGVGERLLFQGFDATTNVTGGGSKPWISDGTTNGTAVLKDIYQGTTGHIVTAFTPLNGKAIFSATDGYSLGRELWKTDGTAAGTTMLADIAVPSGTGNAFPTSPATAVHMAVVGNTLFFDATDGNTSGMHGKELWKTDGTEAGTVLVKDINTGTADSSPQNMVDGGGRLFFQASDGSTNGAELWISDGNTSTTMVSDIRPGPSGSLPANLTYNGSVVVFSADDGFVGSEFWSSDGSSTNTVRTDINPLGSSGPSNFFRDGNDVYFAATGLSGNELYRYRAGTVTLVADCNTSTTNAGSFPGPFYKLGNKLIFRASDGSTGSAHGSELWTLDIAGGTATMIADINPGTASSNPQQMAVAGNLLFFVASDGTTGPAHGFELWATDGNTNTYLVKDIKPGTSSGALTSATTTAIGNKVLFAADNGTNGLEPWVSDGTAAGTFMLKDIHDTSTNLAPFGSSMSSSTSGNPFAVLNGVAYFAANDGINLHGNELWKTDGTSAGTVFVADVNSTGSGTAGYSDPRNFRVMGTKLFFTATDGAGNHGRELFMLDVTP